MAKLRSRRRGTMRLLPLTITMLVLLFIVRMNELYIGSQQLREFYSARDAIAEEKKAEEKSAEGHGASEEKGKTEEGKKPASDEEVKPADAVKEEPTKDAHASESEKKEEKKGQEDPKSDAHADTKKEAEGDAEKKEEGHGDSKKEESGHGEKKEDGHGGAAKPPEEPRTHGTGKSTVKEIEALKAKEAQPRYTQTELDLLQNLVKRRDELDQREKDLSLKSKVLEATEKRINDKITEIKVLEAELSKILAQYNEKQDEQIKSLVKIYESMKPDEAAAIFNEMEMPILLEVIAKMSERKVAPVLANMSPKKAKDVTQELAEKRKKAAMNKPDATTPAAAKP